MDNVDPWRDRAALDRSTSVRTRRHHYSYITLDFINEKRRPVWTAFFPLYAHPAAIVTTITGNFHYILIIRISAMITAIVAVAADRASASAMSTSVIVVCHYFLP
jgi:hypothetical protein